MTRGRLSPLVILAAILATSAMAGDGTASAAESADGGGGGDYVIGIEDVLKVFVWGEPDLTVTAQVRPDGKITVPLIHDVEVVGLTPEGVRRRVRDALSSFIRDPNVTVLVQEIHSYRIYFLGEVRQQGAIEFRRPTTLLQAIAAAGGLTEFSNKEITLVRQEEDGAEIRTKIEFKRLWSGVPGTNFYLEPGDTLLFD